MFQGSYAFFLYDAERKQAFAARDPSGEQELFFCIGADDGSIAFTNSLDQLPPGEKRANWQELLPGHYISGKTPTLKQFALTPEQLDTLKEQQQSGDVDSILVDDEPSPVDVNLPGSLSPTQKPGLFARLSRRSKPLPSSPP